MKYLFKACAFFVLFNLPSISMESIGDWTETFKHLGMEVTHTPKAVFFGQQFGSVGLKAFEFKDNSFDSNAKEICFLKTETTKKEFEENFTKLCHFTGGSYYFQDISNYESPEDFSLGFTENDQILDPVETEKILKQNFISISNEELIREYNLLKEDLEKEKRGIIVPDEDNPISTKKIFELILEECKKRGLDKNL